MYFEQLDNIPDLISSNNKMDITNEDDSNSENEDEWDEMTEDDIPALCLFCSVTSESVDKSIIHLKENHNIILCDIKTKFKMGFYDFIKMVNYIRYNKITDTEFRNLNKSVWDDEKYFKPIIEQDAWLMYDIEDLNVDVISADHDVEISIKKGKLEEMEKLIAKLTQELNSKNLMLEQALEDIEKMKKSYKFLIEKDDAEVNQQTDRAKYIKRDVACVGNLSLQDDEGYFSSYAHFGIHHDMLSDEVRTTSYRDAILKNSSTFAGKNVLDLGCGTSILSMFSSKAGAARVVGVDQSDIIYHAMDIVKRNNIENITLVKGRIEDTELPIDKFDIIVSEWMGYFLLFEGMLDSVIYARKRHLKEDGILLPNRCSISLVGYGDLDRYNEFITFWKDVYGFDMSCMKKDVLREATIEICKPEYVITTSNVILDLDLMTVDVNCPNFSYNFSLNVTKTCKMTSLVGYFDTFFELPEKIEFSTSPSSKPTHWKQIVFYLKKPVDVKIGESITGKFICYRNPKDVRSLSITIEMMGNLYKYSLN